MTRKIKHWETREIIGKYSQFSGTWYVAIETEKGGDYGDKLSGRVILVNSQGQLKPQRLGDYQMTFRGSALYRPWDIEDYVTTEGESKMLRELYMLDGADLYWHEVRCRQRLKSMAAKLRARATGAIYNPSIVCWQRYVLEALEAVLLGIRGYELIDQLAPLDQGEAHEMVGSMLTALQGKRQGDILQKFSTFTQF